MFSTWKTDGSFDLAPRAYGQPAAVPADPSSHRPSYQSTAQTMTPKDAYSILNEWLTMKGDLDGEGDVMVKGRIHGNVRCKMLIIDAGALVEGSITADDVVVRGSARGTVRCKRIRVEKTASIDCEIYHDSFSAEEGARIKGVMHANEETANPIATVGPASDTPEAKVSSALYQMLDVARTGTRGTNAA